MFFLLKCAHTHKIETIYKLYIVRWLFLENNNFWLTYGLIKEKPFIGEEHKKVWKILTIFDWNMIITTKSQFMIKIY